MGEITLRKALKDYKTIYMAYRNFAQRTRVEYLNDLEDFVEFLEKSGIHHVKEVGLPIIERYAAKLEQKGFASLTRKRKVVAIRSFLLFLYQDGYIENNIARRVILPFAESSVPQILTQSECERLRAACTDSPRDAAIIELLLQTGIRLSELISLTLSDIEIEKANQIGESYGGFVRILGGRGRKDRVITLNTNACVALRNYLSSRNAAGSDSLFLNRFGEPLGKRGVQKMLRKYFRRSEAKRASVHTLRHTFASHRAATGTSAATLRDILGCKDPRTTKTYFYMAEQLYGKEN